MDTVRRRLRLSLSTLGILSILVGYGMGGGLLSGYSMSGSTYLVYGGAFALLLAGANAVLARTSLNADLRATVAATLAFLALYPIAVGTIWYDLVVTPPANYSPDPTLIDFLDDRLAFVLLLSPLPAGYVLGASADTLAAGRRLTIPVLTVMFVGGSFVLSHEVMLENGGHPGFTTVLVGLYLIAGVLGAIPFYVVARRRYGESGEETHVESGLGSEPRSN